LQVAEKGILWAQIEAGVEVLRLAAVLVCSSDFGSMPLVFAIFFSIFWGSGFRSRRAPIIGSHAFARARLDYPHSSILYIILYTS
jgi:hypothetical protein